MKVVILCGGLGTRLKEETEYKPKPMVEIGGKPIVWHIMKNYSCYGFNNFVLCLGYKGSIIKDYFINYDVRNNDFTLKLQNQEITLLNQHTEFDWEITFAETGPNTMTGGRIKKIEKYIDGDLFMLTYGDGVSNVNLSDLLAFHQSHGKTGTITGVMQPSRFGELITENHFVKNFNEKPQIHSGGLINGGYFVFNKNFFKYLSNTDDCIFEKHPLENLANDGELCVFEHRGFWQCMDTYREFEYLNNLWKENKASWKIWK